MTKSKLLPLLFILGLTGCTDTVDSVCREYRAANNECIDALMMVTSEAQAERMTARIFKPMKDRYGAIDTKLKIVRANRDMDELIKETFESDQLHLYLTDLQINLQRYSLELTRLRNLRRQLVEREKELLGDPNAVVNAADVCPKLNDLLTIPGPLDVLEKALFEPDVIRMMSEFPNKKVKNYDELFTKFSKRRQIFLPAKNIVLVQ